jgi:predicted dehydrogenase
MNAAHTISASSQSMPSAGKPRLGFLGAGWIGRSRMEAIQDAGVATVISINEPSGQMASAAKAIAPSARFLSSYDELLEMDLDGIVIATPSAMHADQTIKALEKGFPVFCQKPLARNAAETRRVIEAANTADKLLAVDLSYRHVDGAPAIKELISSGDLGEIFAVDLVFHNAYGPDKPWFFDPKMSGGGCLIDLGIHLIDFSMWMLDFPSVSKVESQLYAGGHKLSDRQLEVEDYAAAQVEFESGTTAQIACSWNLNAGQPAAIRLAFYGTRGGACIRNIEGSFFDFTAELYRGTKITTISEPSAKGEWSWGGKAAIAWATQISRSPEFDTGAYSLIDVAEVIDSIYCSADKKVSTKG